MAAFVVPDVGEPFVFTVGRGKAARTYSVPRLPDLETDEFNEVMDGLVAAHGDNRAAVMVARDVFERHAPGSTEGLTYGQLGALSDAWAVDGGEEAGEEGSSSE